MKLNLALAGLALVATAGLAQAQSNLLTNAGFENVDPIQGDGFAEGWTSFGNAYREPGYCAGNSVAPLEGSFNMGTFGAFNGGFSVGGFFQDVAVVDNDIVYASINVLVPSCDPIVGGAFGTFNIEFYDASNVQVAIVFGGNLANSSSALDTWTEHTVKALAPANAVKARVVGLFFQYNNTETGSAKWDSAKVTKGCPADVNKDQSVDFGDFLAFFNGFDTGC
jgi:hypothetical protein